MLNSKIKKHIKEIGDFVQSLSKFSDSPLEFSPFKTLVRTSLIKNYEFLKLVYLDEKFDNYFFIISFLRSNVEDIIVLGYSLPSRVRCATGRRSPFRF